MTDPTNTIVSLRDYVDKRLELLERQITTAERNNEIAIDKADKVLTYRLEGMNEWRASLSDMTSRYVARMEYTAKIDAIQEQVATLAKNVYMIMGGLTALNVLIQVLIQVYR